MSDEKKCQCGWMGNTDMLELVIMDANAFDHEARCPECQNEIKPIDTTNMSDEKNKFNALMHCGMYADANRLEKGIYICSKPFIYSLGDTIEMMIDNAKQMKDMTGANFISESYFDNLKKCELVPIIITKSIEPTTEKPSAEDKTTYSVKPFDDAISDNKFNVVRDDGRIMGTVIGNIPAQYFANVCNNYHVTQLHNAELPDDIIIKLDEIEEFLNINKVGIAGIKGDYFPRHIVLAYANIRAGLSYRTQQSEVERLKAEKKDILKGISKGEDWKHKIRWEENSPKSDWEILKEEVESLKASNEELKSERDSALKTLHIQIKELAEIKAEKDSVLRAVARGEDMYASIKWEDAEKSEVQKLKEEAEDLSIWIQANGWHYSTVFASKDTTWINPKTNEVKTFNELYDLYQHKK